MPEPVELLTIGPPHLLLQNEVYALPARFVEGFADVATLEVTSGTTGTTAWDAISTTTTDGKFSTAAIFVRCTTSGGATVSLKAY